MKVYCKQQQSVTNVSRTHFGLKNQQLIYISVHDYRNENNIPIQTVNILFMFAKTR